MNTHQGVRAGTVLCTAIVLWAGSVGSMEIKEFDKMSDDDRHFYTTCMVVGIMKFLLRTHRDEEYDNLLPIFRKKPSGELPDGWLEFHSIMDEVREIERQNLTKKIPHVEHAMAVMLKRHSVVIDMKKMMQFTRDFGRVKEPGHCTD